MQDFEKREFVVRDGELVEYNGSGGDVVIPYGVISIGVSAFFDAGKSIMSITVPKSLVEFSGVEFWHCENLQNIIVDENNPKYCAIDGSLYTKDKKELVRFASTQEHFQFPNGLTSIGEGAFSGSNIKDIEIPEGITSIGEKAFHSCENLVSIKIPNSVTRIGWEAFQYCKALTSINIGEGVEKIQKGSFVECTHLTEIELPNSVTTIEHGAFYCCTRLTSIKMGGKIEYIGSDAFGGCNSLSKVYFAGTPRDWAKIEFSSGFSNPLRCELKPHLYINGEDVKLMKSLNIVNVSEIGDYEFSVYRELTSINISNSVTKIGKYAFKGCSRLTNVSISNSVKEIGSGAFNGAKNLTEITFLGTKAEWKAIKKGSSWNHGMPKYVVKCKDGNVKIGLFYKE